jgi:hypothetical protein
VPECGMLTQTTTTGGQDSTPQGRSTGGKPGHQAHIGRFVSAGLRVTAAHPTSSLAWLRGKSSQTLRLQLTT